MSNEELVERIQNGENIAENMESLFMHNLTMIKRFVKPFSHCDDMEDLIQESYFGLLEAAKRYDSSIGVKFMTYAQHWIVQSVHSYVAKNSSCVRIPMYLREAARRYNKYVVDYEQEHSRKPSVMQAASDLDLSIKQIGDIISYNSGLKSLDAAVGENSNGESVLLSELVPDERTDVEGEVLDSECNDELRRDLETAINKLDDTEGRVIHGIYFDGMSADELSDSMNVSRQRVYNIHRSALQNMKRKSRKLLYQYAETFGLVTRGGFKQFRQTQTSTVEYIAMRRMEIEEEMKRRRAEIEEDMKRRTLAIGC